MGVAGAAGKPSRSGAPVPSTKESTMKDGKRTIAGLALIALLAGGCNAGPGQPGATQSAARTGGGSSQTEPGTQTRASRHGESVPQRRFEAGSQSRDAAASLGDPAGTAAKPPGPLPPKLPWKPEVPAQARVTPGCVPPGGTVSLTVDTKPEAAIAYQAVYADNKGGADAPLGGGYGGNASGESDEGGRFESTWVVSPDAPAGPARVDVIIGWAGEREAKWGYAGPKFQVASSPTGGC